jgi:hypothetical protein
MSSHVKQSGAHVPATSKLTNERRQELINVCLYLSTFGASTMLYKPGTHLS